jgi:hypothetical protein
VTWSRWSRRALVVVGCGIMAYAVRGALTDPDVRPVGYLLFLTGVVVAHDAVLLPAAIGVGVLIGRFLPAGLRVPARVAGLVTAALLVVAAPLALGFGRRPDTPSALPLPYGRGAAITILFIWATAPATVVLRQVAVGWATADHLRTDLIDQALTNAVTRRRPPLRGRLIHVVCD